MKWTPIKKNYRFKQIYSKSFNMNDYLIHLGANEEMVKLLLNPCEEHDAGLMHDLNECVAMLLDYNRNNKKIAIVGDYDADGVTATSILLVVLKHLGANVDFAIPHRIHDGYGLNMSIIDKLVEKNTDLIITVDNGIAAHDAVSYARSKGIKVIVTDHHQPGETLPDADLIVHPALPGYPFESISGATVAYKIAKELLKAKPDKELEEYILQLASISIVSDVMPVASFESEEMMRKNENRGILMKGLESMRTSPNWHLKILAEIMNINLEKIDETMIGFYIAPVINAVGRLDDACEAVYFLTADTESDAILKCSIMAYLNEQRKELKKEYLDEIKPLIDETKSAIVIKHEEIHEGIIGIIAGNVAEEYGKPTVIFAPCTVEMNDGSTEKAWKASARSSTINLYECLASIEEKIPGTIYRFGGHEGAAGLTVLDKKINLFGYEFVKKAGEMSLLYEPERFYLNVSSAELNNMGECLNEMKPFGRGFPKPVVRTKMQFNQVDVFNSSKHVLLSNPYRNEIWMFGALDSFKEKGYLENFEECMNNELKLINEKGYSAEDAARCKWQRFKSQSKENDLSFDMFLEIDYGEMNGKMQVQTRILDYERI